MIVDIIRKLWPAFSPCNLFPVLFACIVLSACADREITWDNITSSGKLRFVTLENPVTFYETPSGPAGFEYELAKRFAARNNLELQILIADTAYDAVSMIRYNKAAIAGAALIKTDLPDPMTFGPSYYTVPLQLIYRNGEKEPDTGEITNNASAETIITKYLSLRETYPHFSVNQNEDDFTLAQQIQGNEITSTIANAHMVDAFRYLYPDIRVAGDLTRPQPVAWLYKAGDRKLMHEINTFFRNMEESGELAALIEQFFGHIEAFDYVDTRTFINRIENRLPRYQPLFMKIAKKYEMDWTLLAAMSYQESHWNARARSPTGVRGLMMLTETTAEHVGIEDRLDPEQSIEGGTRYYLEMLGKIPQRIPLPDRRWFALAAYNIGFLHLENSRVITQSNGGNPDSWQDVRDTLIAISEDKQYRHLQAGEIRWREPVHYVHKIRKYQDALRWNLMNQQRMARKSGSHTIPVINSPAL